MNKVISLLFIALIIQYTSQANGPAVKSIVLPNQVKLEYAEQGDPKGPTLILLHGYTDSWHSYETLLAELPQNIHAFAISQRGHGNSDKPLLGYHPDDFAGDIAAFIETLGLCQVVIAGHSMGAAITQSFVIKYPHHVKGLVLIASFASFSKNPAVGGLKEMVMQFRDPVDSAFADGFQRSTLVKPIDSVYLNKLIRESLKVPARVWKGALIGMLSADYTIALQSVKKPMTILWGDKDEFCPRADQLILKNSVKGAVLKTYPGTGHAVHWENPKTVARDIADFIKRIG
ncbi:MAG: alpha/beta hydrolase [Gemmatimonadaceae bacterium]|nr:alpha/beta hydrolase [Chitinophagaceae bacterium]